MKSSERRAPPERSLGLAAAVLLLLCLFVAWPARAAPLELHGRWFDSAQSRPVDRLAPTGGAFAYEAQFQVERAGTYVVDFRNSSVIGRFEHRIVDAHGRVAGVARGGLQSREPGPFFLRHGREFTLAPGAYRLQTRVDSPFFLAQPEPYVDALDHYRQAIKPGNALVLLCLGVFIGLGVYYACLALVRRRLAEGMYAVFIAGNLVYNATALLVAGELFGADAFYLVSAPILFSNIAYVVFVMSLLQLRKHGALVLHRAGQGVIAVMVAFIAVALFKPNWSLEFDRAGVGLFLIFGMAAGIRRAWAGDKLARWYLVANAGFFVTGFAAISLLDMGGLHTLYVEHVGLVAVTIEVLLLALVLSYQFGQLQQASVDALARAEANLQLALTDALTRLPNRHALELALNSLPVHGSLTFIDIDGLKLYNDHFGHAQGDRLLQDFSTEFARRLGAVATLHRLGGDEFAAVSIQGDVSAVEGLLGETIHALRHNGYELIGASFGSVRKGEASDSERLKHLADTRMYEHKGRRRAGDAGARHKDFDPVAAD